MMSAANKTLRQDSVEYKDEPDDTVHCQGCQWHGHLGDLLVSEYPDNDTLYCPQCKWLGWSFC